MTPSNHNIASAIELPSTHFLLEYVRPDFLALRVISKALILWDTVEPSSEWIVKQLPVVVRDAYKQMQLKIKRATELHIDGAAPMIDREATEASSNRKEVHFDTGVNARESEQNSHLQDYDCQAVRQIYTFVVAGACFALGLRFAGTCDKRAAAAIFERVVELQTLRDASDSVSLALRPEPQILETCLGCCAISLAMVQAGSGDLKSLKLFKILRWRCDEQVKYGAHMSYGIAIGLLFLGGGTCTLDRTPEAIAALVAAFFPRFPITTTDNQYHLQALRHLYALAVKRRDLRFIDVDTGEVVPIEVEVSAFMSFAVVVSLS
jgi:anaphase-promoting complex subunit 1